jgi:hypothetical protein
VDGGRTYAEQSVVWVQWWVGPIALIAALAVFASLAAGWVRWWQSGSMKIPGWFPPAFIGLGSTVLSLYRPGITPDHPWADRRLVTVVLPTVVLASVAGLAWLVRRLRHRSGRGARVLSRFAVAAGCLALLVPPALGTASVAGRRTEQGELRAQREVCSALRPGDVVLAVDSRAINEWPQVVRGVCDHPVGVIRADPPDREAAIARAAARIEAAGGRPVLLAANDPAENPAPGAEPDGGTYLRSLGLEPVLATGVRTTEDQRLLTRRPSASQGLNIDVWLAPWR